MKRSLAALVLAAAAGRASADNLAVNGSFASNIQGWSTALDATATWTPEDATGGSGSGSARVVNSAQAAGTIAGLSQCLAVRAGQAYGWGARVKVSAPSGVSAFVTLSFFDGGACGGTELARSSTDGPVSSGVWELVSAKSATAPEGALSARVLLAVQKASVGGTAEGLFDDAFVEGPPSSVLVVPASASIHGVNGSFFHTDLWLVNRSYLAPVTVTARYRCYLFMTCPSAAPEVVIPPRGTAVLADVVGAFFSAPETAGAIELSWDPNLGPVSGSSRTYTPSLPAPTFGTSVPALAASEARTATLFPGLGNNGGDLSSGFRTNTGAYNPTDTPARVTMSLFTAAGALGSPVFLDLAPREARQVNDIFGAAGVPSTVTTGAYLVVTSAPGVFAYAIVIDNQSGDSVFVPGSADELAP